MEAYSLHCAKYNEIIYFALLVKLSGGWFTPDPTKCCIFHANNFIYISQESLKPNFQYEHTLVIFCLTHYPLG